MRADYDRRGVYAVGHNRLSQEATYLAGVLATGKGAALSHQPAARHWQVRRRKPDGIDVLVPGQRRAREGIRVHRCRALSAEDVTIYRGIPITTVPRTLSMPMPKAAPEPAPTSRTDSSRRQRETRR